METTSTLEPQMSEAPPTITGSDRPSTTRNPNFYNEPAVQVLLFIQIVLGYEWLASGITKVASGNFVSGMAGALKDKSQMASHWYQSFLNSTIIPYAHTYAVLLEVGEVLVGLGFIVAAIMWARRWPRLSDRGRMWVLLATMLAALGGTVMAVNFHLLNGGNHPWLIPKEGFDETIDLDMFMTLLQAAYFFFCGYLLLKIRRAYRAESAARAESTAALASTAARAPAAHSSPTAAPVATARVAGDKGTGPLPPPRPAPLPPAVPFAAGVHETTSLVGPDGRPIVSSHETAPSRTNGGSRSPKTPVAP